MRKSIAALALMVACSPGLDEAEPASADLNSMGAEATFAFTDSDDVSFTLLDSDDPTMKIISEPSKCTACNELGSCVIYQPTYIEMAFRDSMASCLMPLIELVVELCQAGGLPDGFNCELEGE